MAVILDIPGDITGHPLIVTTVQENFSRNRWADWIIGDHFEKKISNSATQADISNLLSTHSSDRFI